MLCVCISKQNTHSSLSEPNQLTFQHGVLRTVSWRTLLHVYVAQKGGMLRSDQLRKRTFWRLSKKLIMVLRQIHLGYLRECKHARGSQYDRSKLFVFDFPMNEGTRMAMGLTWMIHRLMAAFSSTTLAWLCFESLYKGDEMVCTNNLGTGNR